MNKIKQASKKIINGDIVVFPTETVYGIGANALCENAVGKIFNAKKRPPINPLIVHFYSLQHVEKYFNLNDIQKKLFSVFSPGPLTLIIQNTSTLFPKNVTANKKTIGIRIPSNINAIELIKHSGVPIAAPSANLSKKTSPTSTSHLDPFLLQKCGEIIIGDDCEIGLESTIIDTTLPTISIIRSGTITKQDIEEKTGLSVELLQPENEKNPSSPGQLFDHYQADIPIYINQNINNKSQDDFTIGHGDVDCDYNLSLTSNLKQMAKNIFKAIHKGNEKNIHNENIYKKILISPIQNKGIGIAINDKLNRAKKKGE